MLKPKVLILSGYGLNCEEETKFAFEWAGAEVNIVHVNDLIAGSKKLKNYQILVIPGGFSFGDDTGSGKAYALKLKNHLWNQINKFIREDKLVIGICNGFQILLSLGVLPAWNNVALINNSNNRYTVGWVNLKIENRTPWFYDIVNISLPIAHGEGRIYTKNEINKDIIAARYTGKNPNGSFDNIAALTDPSGRILGMMPHPERAMFFTQTQNWTYLKEKYMRENVNIPKEGPGLKIFQNGVKYFL